MSGERLQFLGKSEAMLRSSRGIFVTRNWDFENTFREVALIFQQENVFFYCNRECK